MFGSEGPAGRFIPEMLDRTCQVSFNTKLLGTCVGLSGWATNWPPLLSPDRFRRVWNRWNRTHNNLSLYKLLLAKYLNSMKNRLFCYQTDTKKKIIYLFFYIWIQIDTFQRNKGILLGKIYAQNMFTKLCFSALKLYLVKPVALDLLCRTKELPDVIQLSFKLHRTGI